MNSKQTSYTNSFCPLPLFRSHPDPLKHLMYLFCFNKYPLSGNLGKWIALLNLFFPRHLIIYLEQDLVGITISTFKELTSTLKDPPSTVLNENVTNCLASRGCWTYCASSLVFFSTDSSSKSLIMMNANVNGVVCLQRSFKVSSSPPTVAKRLNASKISCSMFCFPQNSRYFHEMQEVVLMQVVQYRLLWLLKNFLSNPLQFSFLCFFLFPFSFQFCLPLACFLLIDLRHSLPHFDTTKNIRKSKMKK